MTSNGRRWAKKIARWTALAVITGAVLYTFVPAVQNQFGSVDPETKRLHGGNFTARSLKGDEWSLGDQRGKVVLLNFWATWCPPCRVETPSLVSLHAKYGDRGFTVVGITMDDNPQIEVPAFIAKFGIRYQVLVPNDQISLMQHVETIPTSFLIDKTGRIARTYVGLVTEIGLRDDIEALLSE